MECGVETPAGGNPGKRASRILDVACWFFGDAKESDVMVAAEKLAYEHVEPLGSGITEGVRAGGDDNEDGH